MVRTDSFSQLPHRCPIVYVKKMSFLFHCIKIGQNEIQKKIFFDAFLDFSSMRTMPVDNVNISH